MTPLSFLLTLSLPAARPEVLVLAPGLVLAVAGLAFGLAWLRARGRVRAYFEAPLRLKWSIGEAETPVPPEIDSELRGLGYQPAGTLLQREPLERSMAVYLHQELPVYAFVVVSPDDVRPAVQLDSFFSGGERLSTSGLAGARQHGALVETGVPRLVQYRLGGTPTALDGQHVGTLKAWVASRSGGPRQALPATREALIGYLEADHTRTREALESRGWVQPGTLFRLITGKPRNTLGF